MMIQDWISIFNLELQNFSKYSAVIERVNNSPETKNYNLLISTHTISSDKSIISQNSKNVKIYIKNYYKCKEHNITIYF